MWQTIFINDMKNIMNLLRVQVNVHRLEGRIKLISINGATSIDVKQVKYLTESYGLWKISNHDAMQKNCSPSTCCKVNPGSCY